MILIKHLKGADGRSVRGAEEFSGGDTSRSVMISPAGDKDVSCGEQCGVRTAAPGRHLWERLKFASRGIVELGVIGAVVADPASRDQNLAGAKQNGDVAHAGDGHRTGRLKVSGGRVVQLSGSIKILIAAHAASNENFSAWQKGGGVTGAGFEQGCCEGDRASG